jgi:hypothetical protein
VFGENIENLKRGVFQNLMFKNPYQQAGCGRVPIQTHLSQSTDGGHNDFVKSEVVFQSSISMYKE